jgi:3-phosphoglycerate kinase
MTQLEALAKEKGISLILPTDVVVADKFAADANTQVRSVQSVAHLYAWRVDTPPLCLYRSLAVPACLAM